MRSHVGMSGQGSLGAHIVTLRNCGSFPQNVRLPQLAAIRLASIKTCGRILKFFPVETTRSQTHQRRIQTQTLSRTSIRQSDSSEACDYWQFIYFNHPRLPLKEAGLFKNDGCRAGLHRLVQVMIERKPQMRLTVFFCRHHATTQGENAKEPYLGVHESACSTKPEPADLVKALQPEINKHAACTPL